MQANFQNILHLPAQKPSPNPQNSSDSSNSSNNKWETPELLTEFPGNFCGTLYSSTYKETITNVKESVVTSINPSKSPSPTPSLTPSPKPTIPLTDNIFPININSCDGDYLIDSYLLIAIPDKFIEDLVPQKFVTNIIEGVQLQWSNGNVIHKLLSNNFDSTFDWEYRMVTSNSIAIKLPWFFSKKTKDALPLIFLKNIKLNPDDQQLQFKILFTSSGISDKYRKLKYSFITEYGKITELEREYLKENVKLNRHMRIIYEEKDLDECKESDYIIRLSWNEDSTVMEIDGKELTSKNVFVYPDFYGNEWISKSGRYGHSISIPPGRNISSVMSGVNRSLVKVTLSEETEKIYAVIEKLSIFMGGHILLAPQEKRIN